MSLKNCVFGPQKSDGWDADSAGDWGTEENWESLDGDQGQRLFFFFFLSRLHIEAYFKFRFSFVF